MRAIEKEFSLFLPCKGSRRELKWTPESRSEFADSEQFASLRFLTGDEEARLQKKSAENINARLAMVMKSGKFCLGYKQTLKTLRGGKAKLVIIANNTPPLRFAFLSLFFISNPSWRCLLRSDLVADRCGFQQERDRILRHVGEDGCPPLQRQQHRVGHRLRQALPSLHPLHHRPRYEESPPFSCNHFALLFRRLRHHPQHAHRTGLRTSSRIY